MSTSVPKSWPAPPYVGALEANDLSVRSFRQGYNLGREAGLAEAEARIACLELLADHWYAVAHNPGLVDEERKYNVSFLELNEARAEREAQRQEWDRQEELTFDMARGMIDQGHNDRDIAVALGLFLPIVANLRAGVV